MPFDEIPITQLLRLFYLHFTTDYLIKHSIVLYSRPTLMRTKSGKRQYLVLNSIVHKCPGSSKCLSSAAIRCPYY